MLHPPDSPSGIADDGPARPHDSGPLQNARPAALHPTVSHASHLRRRPGRPTSSARVGEVETRDLILRQARRLFIQRGYADVSVGEVAEAVGVTKPTLYYHFGDKEGMYAAVLADLMGEVGGYIRTIRESDASVHSRLEDIAFGYFLNANGTMEPLLRDALQLIGAEHARVVLAAYEDEFLRPLVDLMAEGMRTGEVRSTDARGLARAFSGLLDAFTAAGGRLARSREEHRQIAREVASLFMDGAAPRA